mmetsp:Transcript_42031/g.116053  ORF Transcript_42031/g.116053 Transcript_42031/m.116053 type:complete len:364 (-) Transcript_42031:79-1170(-)
MAGKEVAELSENATAAIEVINSLTDEELLDSLAAVLVERTTVLQGLIDWAVPEHAYVPSKVITDHRFEGKVKSYSEKDGYGFIDSPGIKEAFGNDVFVHGGQLGNRPSGTEVNFAVLLNKDHKPQAFDVATGKAEEYNRFHRGDSKSKGSKNGKGVSGVASGKALIAPAWTAPAAFGGFAACMKGKGAWGCGETGPWGDSWGGWNGANAWGDAAMNGAAAWKGGAACWGASPTFMKGAGAGGAGKSPGTGKSAGAGKAGPAAKASGSAKDPQTTQEIPGVTDKRHSGSLKSFSAKSGYGFITCDEVCNHFGDEVREVFVHHAQVGDFQVGAEITFAVIVNKDGKPQAKDIEAAGGNAKKRRKM